MNNLQCHLIKRPVGEPVPSDFDFVEQPVREPSDGEVLVKNLFLSLDPAMRGWMMDNKKSYIPPVGLGETMRALGIGKVLKSHDPKYKEGDYVSGLLGVQQYLTGNAKAVGGLTVVQAGMVPMERYLSVLGMPGMTGYFGLLTEAKPQEGETVVISGASGAVGAVVGQIAKIKGCKVVGIAGGEEKCRYLTEELGFDAAIDYKTSDVSEELRKHCPKGLDIYFDNVGGEILDAALANLAMHARIIICGAISQYNNTGEMYAPKNYLAILPARATMRGIVVMDYVKEYAEAGMQMATWMMEGKFKAREDVRDGLENFPEVLMDLFTGDNNGKLVLKVAEGD